MMMKSARGPAGALFAAALLLSAPGKAQTGAAPVLKVESLAPTGTGTTHYAVEMRLSTARSEPLVLKTQPGSKLIPVPGPQYPIDDSHVLLLGWSSYGGGMQTLHALLVQVENGSVKLQRELTLTAARMASPLIVRRDGLNGLLLGVGEPGPRLFNEGDWLLVLGPGKEDQLNIGAIRKLAFVSEAKRDADELYAPPFQNARFPARVTWLSVSANGFAPIAGGR
jgi:hypothetical protein